MYDQVKQKIVGEIEINKTSSVQESYSTTSTSVLKNWVCICAIKNLRQVLENLHDLLKGIEV